MNCKNNKTSDPHRLLLNLTDNTGLISDKYIYYIIKSQHALYMKKYRKVI